jgi:hypothetical protein
VTARAAAEVLDRARLKVGRQPDEKIERSAVALGLETVVLVGIP